MNSIGLYFVAFTMLALGTSFSGFLPISATLVNWFFRKRSLAMGIAMSGMGVGGLFAPVLALSLTTLGWRTTAVISGFIIWSIGVPMSLLLRHKPEQYGYLPDGRQPASADGQQGSSPAARATSGSDVTSESDFPAREALRTSAFWLLAAGHASALLVVSTVALHQVPHMVQQLGMSLEAAGGIVAYMMGMSIVGRLSGGFLADRINKRALLAACMLGHTAGLLSLAYATNLVHLIMYGTFHGLAWGARAPTQQSIRADYFGRTSFATIVGFSSVVITVTSITAPIFAGWLADIRGNYRLPFTILALLTGLGSIFFLFARRPAPRRAPPGVVQ